MALTKKNNTGKTTKKVSKWQRSASIQKVNDEEPAHGGEVLDSALDVIMEEVGTREKSPGSVNTVSDDEDDEEKLRECSKAG